MIPTERDINREIYRIIYKKIKNEINPNIEMRHYNANFEKLPFDDAAFLSRYKGKVRHLEFILP